MLLHQQKIAKHTFCSKLSDFDFYLLNFWSYCLSTNCSMIGVSQCFPTITVRVRCWWWVWLLSGGKKNKLPLKLETKSHSGGCVLYRPGTNNKRRERKKSFLESFSWWTQKIQLLCEKIINWKIVFRKILKNFWIMIQINITKN